MEEHPTVEATPIVEAATLSKNAQKRLLKKKKQEETKVQWRKKNREKRKLSIIKKREQGLPVPKRFKPDSSVAKNGNVCFDFDYNGLMNDTVPMNSFSLT